MPLLTATSSTWARGPTARVWTSGKSLEIVGTSGYQQTILNNNGGQPKFRCPGESTVRVAGFSIINGVGASMTSVLEAK